MSGVSVYTHISPQQHEALAALAARNNVPISLYLRGIIADAIADEHVIVSRPTSHRRTGPHLTPVQRVEILDLVRQGRLSFKDIATRYDVMEQTISAIAKRFGLQRTAGGRQGVSQCASS